MSPPTPVINNFDISPKPIVDGDNINVAWDVAGLAAGASPAFVDELLAGYGDAGDLEPFLDAHALYDVIWQAHKARRP